MKLPRDLYVRKEKDTDGSDLFISGTSTLDIISKDELNAVIGHYVLADTFLADLVVSTRRHRKANKQ